MNHLLAILGLGVACVLWYFVQRLAARSEAALQSEDDSKTAGCGTCTACDPEEPEPEPGARGEMAVHGQGNGG